ncbi:uncharacterized protein MONOS_2487 [Monocercomonoides exilis]|uniref:uncharacterized protein n=1 Tax=Monocercomonoides exilis TaxID=2049356 RepID=UPI00355A6E82|nr:hypothetical protein MONOS_2487 [Monocercomonoides exilis]|eukprot:MONOS_2487.1-p1 / transcript=MONOS_2487.1 / gene=MONOS_2487 / organism=Monocercomonoides_exilis_PA203 / gene_product=unspecified product / transcript_product=unspecified product / location=Mono_scaffold00051:152803-154443(-) / protein_length=547 / sequence_SO=supercontig / SO=protein_coding / is_pseudo=false
MLSASTRKCSVDHGAASFAHDIFTFEGHIIEQKGEPNPKPIIFYVKCHLPPSIHRVLGEVRLDLKDVYLAKGIFKGTFPIAKTSMLPGTRLSVEIVSSDPTAPLALMPDSTCRNVVVKEGDAAAKRGAERAAAYENVKLFPFFNAEELEKLRELQPKSPQISPVVVEETIEPAEQSDALVDQQEHREEPVKKEEKQSDVDEEDENAGNNQRVRELEAELIREKKQREEDVEELRRRNVETETVLEKEREEIANKEIKFGKSLAEAKEEIEKLHVALKEQELQNEKNCLAEKEKMAELAELRKELEAKSSEMQMLNEEYQKAEEKIQELSQSFESSKQSVEVSQQEKAKMEQEINLLKEQAEAGRMVSSEVDDLTERLSELEKELEKERNEKTAIEERMTSVELQLRADIGGKTEMIADKQKEIEELEQKIQTAQGSLRDACLMHEKEICKLKEEHETTQKTLLSKENELRQLEDKLAQMEQKHRECVDSNEQLISAKDAEISQLKADLSVHTQELLGALDRLQNAIDASKKLEEEKDELSGLNSEA